MAHQDQLVRLPVYRPPRVRIGAREREVIEKVFSGMHYREIAAAHGVKHDCVKKQVHSVLKKCGVRSICQLAVTLARDRAEEQVGAELGELRRKIEQHEETIRLLAMRIKLLTGEDE